ncbi:MAG: tonB [Gammaproteobacteria bacterium]|jgi:TonB family protein|nr:tonB [Gammaproteobacteria bacterium]
MKSWLMAISLHLAVLGFLIGLPQFAKMESLPKKTGGISVFLVSATGQALNQSARNFAAEAHSVNSGVKLDGNNKTIGVHQTTSQQIAPQNIQILLDALDRDIQAHLVYPDLAQSTIQQGSTQLAFDLQPNGQISDIELVKSSGAEDLDQAAINAVQKSSPIAMPIHLNQSIHLSLPVNFSLE